MKTLDQIYRYTSQCKFPPEDWQKVLDYCRERFKGGKIHLSKRPISDSTFEQFLDWIENGYGSGDIVGYGRTVGIIGSSTPDSIELIAYCDFNGRLIVQKFPEIDKSRIKHISEERENEFKNLLISNHLRCNVRSATIVKVNTPKKYSYVITEDDKGKVASVGMWLESMDCKTHFAALLENDNLYIDHWAATNYTPYKLASERDIKRLHRAASKDGYYFDERLKRFVKAPKRGKGNVYWYLNDRFELELDRDDGSKRHTGRCKVGNYFMDQATGLSFADDVIKRAKHC